MTRQNYFIVRPITTAVNIQTIRMAPMTDLAERERERERGVGVEETRQIEREGGVGWRKTQSSSV